MSKETAWGESHCHHEVFGDGNGSDQVSKGLNKSVYKNVSSWTDLQGKNQELNNCLMLSSM